MLFKCVPASSPRLCPIKCPFSPEPERALSLSTPSPERLVAPETSEVDKFKQEVQLQGRDTFQRGIGFVSELARQLISYLVSLSNRQARCYSGVRDLVGSLYESNSIAFLLAQFCSQSFMLESPVPESDEGSSLGST